MPKTSNADATYLKRIREQHLQMRPTEFAAFLGYCDGAVAHNEQDERTTRQRALIVLYNLFEDDPKGMIERVLFSSVPKREYISDIDLRRLISLAQQKIPYRFNEWVTLMKKKFQSNHWASIPKDLQDV